MMEEMLLSPVLPVMTVYRLKAGGNVSRGFVANLKQDSLKFIKQIPLTADQLPILVVWRVGKNNEAVDFKVNRTRVSLVGQWLVNNHPGFQHHNVTFNQNHCNVLPVDGILGGLPEVEVDDFDVEDEGPIPREQHEEDDDLPPDHAFLEEHTLTAQRDDIVKGLNPTLWP